MEQRVYNFSAGPATLPLSVMEQIKADLPVYPGAGASIMEISHRSKVFAGIHQQAKDNIKALLNIPENYHILFTPGGASLQFSMIPMNLMAGKAADYIDSGSWGGKAIKEAKKFGEVRTVWSGKEGNFNRMPKPEELDLNTDAAYFHFTSNETIQGIEFFEEPGNDAVPRICDASSDFLSRPLDIKKYALMYAGAQKNVGPSGMAVVIIRDDMLERTPANLPSLLDYSLLAKNDSLYNTPPSFTIYVVALVTQWLRDEMGGLEGIAALNEKKAGMLYGVIDNSEGFYRGHAEKDCRSRMNVSFRLPDETLEARFVEESKAAGLDALKGHRSVGGCRASIYNAMPLEGVEALCAFMKDFQQKNA